MKLSIRLQRYGNMRNHPLWRIVVAPNRKNIIGRFTQHVGLWSPRKGINMQRQIVLNIVRVKHWISCGAVPTPKIQRFLSYYDIMPTPWYYKKSEAQIQALKQKNKDQELSDKKKRKLQWKQRSKNREQFSIFNQYKMFKGRSKKQQQLFEFWTILERQNEFLRSVLMERQLESYEKIRKLSNQTQEMNLHQIKNKIQKLKNEYIMMTNNAQKLHPMKQAMIADKLNELFPKLIEFELKQQQKLKEEQSKEENLQNIILKRAISHQLHFKKIQKFQKQMKQYYENLQPLTQQSFAQFLVSKGLTPNDAAIKSKQYFQMFALQGDIPRKGDIKPNISYEDLTLQNQQFRIKKQQIKKQKKQAVKKVHVDYTRDGSLREFMGGKYIPLPRKPIHPFPDLHNYYPEQFYEPPKIHRLGFRNAPQYFPEEELKKYKSKQENFRRFKN